MSKILKAASVKIDENNRVSVEVLDPAALAEMQELQKSESERFEPEVKETPEETARGIIEAAEMEAKRIIEDASEEAEALVESRRLEFEDELADLKEETLKEAFDEGYGRGYEESKGIRAQADEILQDAYRERDETFANMEPELAELIGKIVRKLTADIAELNPQLIACLIGQGLDAANAPGDVTVHISELDYEEAIKHKSEYLSHTDTGARVDVIKDPSLKKSDCIIETPYGNIDCSLEQQFTSLKENIFYILNNR